MKKSIILLSVIFLVGLFFRLYKLDTLPNELHRDEAAIGYNALSILKTGKDEHGAGPFPTVFLSFGDYKLPGLIYLTAASIQLLGVSIIAVRLPVALVASLLVPAVFFLIHELYASKRTALVAAFLAATSFVHIFTSRTAYEPAVALTLFITALTFLLAARRRTVFWIPALIFFSLSFFTYNVPLLITPVLLGATLYLWRAEYLKNKKVTAVAIGIFGLIWCVSLFSFKDIITGKLGATIFTNQPLLQESLDRRISLMRSGLPYRFSNIVINDYLEMIQNISERYLKAFDTQFLFFEGGTNHWHSLGGIRVGNLSIFLAPFIAWGLFLLFSDVRHPSKLSKASLFLLIYLVLSMVPNGITIDSPVTNRLMDFQLILLLLAAKGVDTFLQSIGAKFVFKKHKLQYLSLVGSLSLVYLFFFTRFWLSYSQLFNQKLDRSWGEGATQLAQEVALISSKYDQIYMSMQPNSGLPDVELFYVYLALFNQTDPATFQKTAVWKHDSSFLRPASFDKFVFKKIGPEMKEELSALSQKTSKPQTLLNLEWLGPNEEPRGDAVILIKNSSGEPSWQATEIKLAPTTPTVHE